MGESPQVVGPVRWLAGLVLLASLGGAAEEHPGDLSLEPYSFETRAGDRVEAELGHLVVPERPDRKGRLIRLAFVRFRSTSPRPGAPIVYLAGGPGGSGIELARGPRHPLFMALREAGDVIALDQRGAGLSEPRLDCPERVSVPLDAHLDRQGALRLLERNARDCAAHWRRQGVDLSAYNTNNNGRDKEGRTESGVHCGMVGWREWSEGTRD